MQELGINPGKSEPGDQLGKNLNPRGLENTGNEPRKGMRGDEFKLPELGENIEQGDLVRLMVSPGASVSAGQSVMELETDKAVVEVPSSVSGTVQEIRVKEGDKIKVGQVIFTVETAPRRQRRPRRGCRESPCATLRKPTPPKQESVLHQLSAPRRAAPAQPSAPQPLRRLPAPSEFKLPELGENISQGDLVRLMIAPGAKVSEGQPVMELETDKAVVEVPSSVSGVVKEVKVKEGREGQSWAGDLHARRRSGLRQPKPARSRNAPVEHVSGQHGARLAFQAAIRAEGKTEEQALPPDQPQPAARRVQSCRRSWAKSRERNIASRFRPRRHVRRLAREIGVDIYEVKGTGPGRAHQRRRCEGVRQGAARRGATAAQAPAAAATIR